jgi:lysophospholipase L1-like esterase
VGPMRHPRGYVSPTDGALGLQRFNSVLLDVCQQEGLKCYDLAGAIQPSTASFVDDFHFNESGARQVADFLADHIRRTGPFWGATD